MLHADLGGVLHLLRRSAEHGRESACRHRARDTHLALAADLRAGDRSVLLVEDADGARGQQEVDDAAVARARDEAAVVVQHRGNDAGGAVGRRRHDPAPGRVLLVHRQREQVHPVEHRQRVARAARGRELAVPVGCASPDLQAAGQRPFGTQPALDAALHHLPDREQARIDRLVLAPVALVGAHHLRDRQAASRALGQQFVARVERQRQDRGVGRDALVRAAVACQFLADDEASTHRVVGARSQLTRFDIESDEAQSVGVERQRLREEQQVLLLDEPDWMLAEQPQLPRFADRRQARRDRVHLDSRRLLAFESEQHGLVAAVALAGSTEGSVQLGPHRGDAVDQPLVREPLREQSRGAHRPDGMRAGRPDADLEEVEDADGQWRGRTKKGGQRMPPALRRDTSRAGAAKHAPGDAAAGYATLIETRRGWACSCFGMRRRSTPSFSCASIRPPSSSRLSVKLRR